MTVRKGGKRGGRAEERREREGSHGKEWRRGNEGQKKERKKDDLGVRMMGRREKITVRGGKKKKRWTC